MAPTLRRWAVAGLTLLATFSVAAPLGAQSMGNPVDARFRERMQAQENYDKDQQVEGVRRSNREAALSARLAYANGDYRTAGRIWDQLAQGGDAAAQFSLGMLEEKGQGRSVNHAAATQWFQKSASQGYAPAEFILGMKALNGDGGAANDVEGAKWINRAAHHGLPQAMFNLAILYETGRGISLDPAAAKVWRRRAVEAQAKAAR